MEKFERVKLAEKNPDWMGSFKDIQMPEIKSISKGTTLPVLHDRSFSRTSIALNDTQQGSLRVLVDGADPAVAQTDPRVEQLRRMQQKKQDVLTYDKATKSVSLSQSSPGEPKKGVFGAATEVAQREMNGPSLAAYIQKEIKDRAAGLPAHLRGRMKALENIGQSVMTARKGEAINDRVAMATMADVAERGFLISETAKTPEMRREDSRNGRIDSLFVASSQATRQASRLGVEESFSRGLVSDVMAKDQSKRLEGERGLRVGDDFGSTAQRLNRLGLIAQDDPRLKVDPEKVSYVMSKPQPVKDKFDKDLADEMFPQEGHIARALKEKRAKQNDAFDTRIKHEKPPETTAPTSYQQVGESGRYMVKEFGRDNTNAFEDKERLSKMRHSYEKAKSDKMPFAQSGTLEAGVLMAHRSGRDANKTTLGAMGVAAQANTGVQQVSDRVRQLEVQKQLASVKTQQKSAPVR